LWRRDDASGQLCCPCRVQPNARQGVLNCEWQESNFSKSTTIELLAALLRSALRHEPSESSQRSREAATYSTGASIFVGPA
jgi:hypothetical protein